MCVSLLRASNCQIDAVQSVMRMHHAEDVRLRLLLQLWLLLIHEIKEQLNRGQVSLGGAGRGEVGRVYRVGPARYRALRGTLLT